MYPHRTIKISYNFRMATVISPYGKVQTDLLWPAFRNLPTRAPVHDVWRTSRYQSLQWNASLGVLPAASSEASSLIVQFFFVRRSA